MLIKDWTDRIVRADHTGLKCRTSRCMELNVAVGMTIQNLESPIQKDHNTG